jgi:hypothetical protein
MYLSNNTAEKLSRMSVLHAVMIVATKVVSVLKLSDIFLSGFSNHNSFAKPVKISHASRCVDAISDSSAELLNYSCSRPSKRPVQQGASEVTDLYKIISRHPRIVGDVYPLTQY